MMTSSSLSCRRLANVVGTNTGDKISRDGCETNLAGCEANQSIIAAWVTAAGRDAVGRGAFDARQPRDRHRY